MKSFRRRLDYGTALLVLIERREATERSLRAVERAARRYTGPTAEPRVVLTRHHVRSLIRAYRNGEITEAEVHAWAGAVADRTAPFQTHGPITLEKGHHYALYAVVGNLANDRNPFISLDADGLDRMSRLLDCEDPPATSPKERIEPGSRGCSTWPSLSGSTRGTSMSEVNASASGHQRDIEVNRDGFILVLRSRVNPALVVMSMRMADGSLHDLAEILVNPDTKAVIRHEACGHGTEFPPFRIDAWVDSIKPLLIQSASDQAGTAATHVVNPTTGDLDSPSD